MTVRSWDPYLEQDSPVHRLEASTKLLLLSAYLLTVALLPAGAWQACALVLGLAAAAATWACIPASLWLKRSVIVLPFALAALPLLFTQPGETLFTLSVFGWRLTASGAGLVRLLSILLKSWLSVAGAVILTASTTLPEMLSGLRRLRLPRLLTAMIGLMWRYLFVMIDEAGRLLTARAARSAAGAGGGKPGGSLTWRARVAGGMAGSLFLRSLERSERVYAAMLARGYDGEIRSLPLPPAGLRNRAVLAAGCAGMLCVLFVAFA